MSAQPTSPGPTPVPRAAPNPASPDLTLVNMITENWDGARWLPTGALYLVSALESEGYAVRTAAGVNGRAASMAGRGAQS